LLPASDGAYWQMVAVAAAGARTGTGAPVCGAWSAGALAGQRVVAAPALLAVAVVAQAAEIVRSAATNVMAAMRRARRLVMSFMPPAPVPLAPAAGLGLPSVMTAKSAHPLRLALVPEILGSHAAKAGY
jgi:hypothetical protein